MKIKQLDDNGNKSDLFEIKKEEEIASMYMAYYIAQGEGVRPATDEKKWVSIESLKVEMRKLLHEFHTLENLDSSSYQMYYEQLRERITVKK